MKNRSLEKKTTDLRLTASYHWGLSRLWRVVFPWSHLSRSLSSVFITGANKRRVFEGTFPCNKPIFFSAHLF